MFLACFLNSAIVIMIFYPSRNKLGGVWFQGLGNTNTVYVVERLVDQTHFPSIMVTSDSK